jgi:putative oxidoreductase
MKIATIIARVLLGLVFVVFGLNAFLNFIPMPPPPKGHAGEFFTALYASGYLYAIKCFEIGGGILLLIGKKVPLGLTLLGPVIVNILFYDIFLDRSGLPMGIIIAVLALFLLWSFRSAFAGLLKD